MLNIAGGPPNTIISLRLLPAINKATINPNTIPEPPKYTNASKNAPASTWYPSVAPAWAKAAFSPPNFISIVSVKGSAIFAPWSPTVQSIWIINAISIVEPKLSATFDSGAPK